MTNGKKSNNDRKRVDFRLDPIVYEMLSILAKYHHCNLTKQIEAAIVDQWRLLGPHIKETAKIKKHEIEEWLDHKSRELDEAADILKKDKYKGCNL